MEFRKSRSKTKAIALLTLTLLAFLGIIWAFWPLTIIYEGPSSGYDSALKARHPIRLVSIEPYIKGEMEMRMAWEVREFKARLSLVVGLYMGSLVIMGAPVLIRKIAIRT